MILKFALPVIQYMTSRLHYYRIEQMLTAHSLKAHTSNRTSKLFIDPLCY